MRTTKQTRIELDQATDDIVVEIGHPGARVKIIAGYNQVVVTRVGVDAAVNGECVPDELELRTVLGSRFTKAETWVSNVGPDVQSGAVPPSTCTPHPQSAAPVI